MNPRDPLEGAIVNHGPVHMTAEDYHRTTSSASSRELVPVQHSNQLALPPLPAGAQIIVIQAPAAPAAEPAGKWTPGNVLALTVVAVVGIVALVLIAPLIITAVQTLAPVAAIVAVAVVLLARALRPAPTPEPTKRRRGRRNR